MQGACIYWVYGSARPPKRIMAHRFFLSQHLLGSLKTLKTSGIRYAAGADYDRSLLVCFHPDSPLDKGPWSTAKQEDTCATGSVTSILGETHT